jgi:hypothetical protein
LAACWRLRWPVSHFHRAIFAATPSILQAAAVIGLAIIAGWYVTAGDMGTAWKEWADFAETKPLRVEAQSFTFISPMGDLARYVMNPADTSLINFGIMALAGVILGSWSIRWPAATFASSGLSIARISSTTR